MEHEASVGAKLMITFQPFQQLYQHIKKSDNLLFQTLDKISLYLQNIINGIPDPQINQAQLSYATGQATTNAFVDVAGCILTLKSSGDYLIQGNFSYLSAGVGPSQFQGRIVIDGIVQPGLAIVSTNDNIFDYFASFQCLFSTTIVGKVAKLQVLNNANVGNLNINTNITAIWLGRS